MSQQVNVQRKLVFGGDANIAGNVDGNMLETKRHFADHFLGDTLDTNNWTATVGGSGDVISIVSRSGGGVSILSGDDDSDSCHLGGALIWTGTQKAVMEARVKIADVSATAVFVGFSDATSESNGYMAIDYNAGTLTTTATDAAGFVVDADETSSLIMCAAVKGDTDATDVSTGITWADNETKNLRVELNSTTARFFIDGVPVGTITSAVTAATLLCVTIQVATRGTVQTYVYVLRVDAWQDEA